MKLFKLLLWSAAIGFTSVAAGVACEEETLCSVVDKTVETFAILYTFRLMCNTLSVLGCSSQFAMQIRLP